MIRSCLALFLALATLSPAQDGKKGDLKVRFLAERAPKELGQVVMATEKSKSAPFDLPVNSLSEPIVAPDRAFSLRAVNKDVAVASIALPEGGKSFIVLLVPASTGGYKPVVMAANDPAFKPGDTYFYNHADKTVLGYVGTAKFVLAPGKGQVLRPTGARPEKFYDVGFGVREKSGDRPLSTTRWPVEERIRSYVFFFMNPTSKRVDFRAVDEFVPVEKAEP
jgi:hypothetical protein